MTDSTRFTPRPQDQEEVRAEFGFQPDDFLVTFAARIHDYEDPLTFIRAAAIVAAEKEKTCFLMVGRGEMEYEAAVLARELGLNGRLIITSKQVCVRRILSGSDMFIAISPVENCHTNNVLEALSMKKAVILTNVGKTPHSFPHNEAAWLIPPRNPVALAAAIIRLLDNEPLRTRLAESGPSHLDQLGFGQNRKMGQTVLLRDHAIKERQSQQ